MGNRSGENTNLWGLAMGYGGKEGLGGSGLWKIARRKRKEMQRTVEGGQDFAPL